MIVSDEGDSERGVVEALGGGGIGVGVGVGVEGEVCGVVGGFTGRGETLWGIGELAGVGAEIGDGCEGDELGGGVTDPGVGGDANEGDGGGWGEEVVEGDD